MHVFRCFAGSCDVNIRFYSSILLSLIFWFWSAIILFFSCIVKVVVFSLNAVYLFHANCFFNTCLYLYSLSLQGRPNVQEIDRLTKHGHFIVPNGVLWVGHQHELLKHRSVDGAQWSIFGSAWCVRRFLPNLRFAWKMNESFLNMSPLLQIKSVVHKESDWF